MRGNLLCPDAVRKKFEAAKLSRLDVGASEKVHNPWCSSLGLAVNMTLGWHLCTVNEVQLRSSKFRECEISSVGVQKQTALQTPAADTAYRIAFRILASYHSL